MRYIKLYMESEKNRFMKHHVLWSIYIAGCLAWIGYDAVKVHREAKNFRILVDQIKNERQAPTE